MEKPSVNTISDITHFEVYRKGQKKKQECRIRFKVKQGFIVRIEYNPNDWLFFGCQGKEIASKELKGNIKSVVDKYGVYSSDNFWICWKYLFEEEDQRIYLSDFSHMGTFELIKEEIRKRKVKEIIFEVEKFIERVDTAQNIALNDNVG